MTEAYQMEREPFEVTDDSKADWAAQKIQEAEAEFEKLKDWYQRQIELAKQRRDSDVEYFTSLLQDYFKTVPARETKTQWKYSLPCGMDMVLTKEKDELAVVDEQKLMSWCVSNDPELLKTTVSPKWADIKKRLTLVNGSIVDSETGLFVEGVEMKQKEREFKIQKARA